MIDVKTAIALAEALGTIIAGVALPPSEAAKVQKVIGQLAKTREPAKVTIKAADIEAAVAKVLPGILQEKVPAAVADALAKEAAKDASK